MISRSWPACSGADTNYVITNELPVISPESDIVTLTIGGNNVGFADCANACIFKVNPLPDCGTTLANTGDLINNVLPGQLDAALDAIMTRVVSPGFKLYFTSYPHFWNVDTTACNDVSFNFWAKIKPNFLTQALRTQMNDLTESLNAQISAAVGRANARDNRKPVVCTRVLKPIPYPSKGHQLTRHSGLCGCLSCLQYPPLLRHRHRRARP